METIQKIPLCLNVGGQTISGNIKDRLESDKLGECCVAEARIDIAKAFNGREQAYSSQVNTFYHELTHCILNTMGEDELSGNEKFVCCFSSFLCEAMNKAYFVEDNDADNEVQGDNR